MKKNDIIEVTIPKYHNEINIYKILNTNVINDGRGTILLSKIKKATDQNTELFEVGTNLITVDNKWFNEVLTGRKIKYLTKEGEQ